MIPLLIIGAGPFGLALANCVRSHGIPCLIVGKPMEFWTRHMPKGMLLRSSCEWHLDTSAIDTIDAYLASNGQQCGELEPLSLAFYLRYVNWFMTRKDIHPLDARVNCLDRSDEGFSATLDTG